MCLAMPCEQRAVSHQQHPLPAHDLERIGAEQHAPPENRRYRHGAPQDHQANGQPEARIDVRNQPLEQEGRAHHQAKLLGESDARRHADPRIQILEMKPQQNADQNQENSPKAAVVKEENVGSHSQRNVRGQHKSRRDQQGLTYQESKGADRNENSKKPNHPDSMKTAAGARLRQRETRRADSLAPVSRVSRVRLAGIIAY